MKDWAIELVAKNRKQQIVLHLEPTGTNGFCLPARMITNGINVLQVIRYAV